MKDFHPHADRLRPFLLALCLSFAVSSVQAMDPRDCAGPITVYRARHPPRADKMSEPGVSESAYDEVSLCLTRNDDLSFSLRIAGSESGQCNLRGIARRRGEETFIYLRKGFRLRFEVEGDRLRLFEESDPKESTDFCSGNALIGTRQFRRR